MDLFDYMRENNSKKESPLAMRLRPKTLDDIANSVNGNTVSLHGGKP